MFVRLIF